MKEIDMSNQHVPNSRDFVVYIFKTSKKWWFVPITFQVQGLGEGEVDRTLHNKQKAIFSRTVIHLGPSQNQHLFPKAITRWKWSGRQSRSRRRRSDPEPCPDRPLPPRRNLHVTVPPRCSECLTVMFVEQVLYSKWGYCPDVLYWLCCCFTW